MARTISLVVERAKRLVVGATSYGGQLVVVVVAVAALTALAIGPPLLIYFVAPNEADLARWIQSEQGIAEFVALVAGLGAISYMFTKGADGVLRGLKAIGSEMVGTIKGPWKGGFEGLHQGVKTRCLGLMSAMSASIMLVVALLLLSAAIVIGRVVVGIVDGGARDPRIVTVDLIGTATPAEIVEVNGKLKTITIFGNDSTPIAKVSIMDTEDLAGVVLRNDSKDVLPVGTDLDHKLDRLLSNVEKLDSDATKDFGILLKSLESNFAEMEGHLDRHRDQIVSKVQTAQDGLVQNERHFGQGNLLRTDDREN
ncbi:MAG: hypothetical protein OXJ53_06880 [Gammaproteobacteria bacterium]|nr:hypothetical protein [Gammaproteobacteria bacterium]MDE0273648.1 hypothetical protein [Gammaproteobacteria bacterium]